LGEGSHEPRLDARETSGAWQAQEVADSSPIRFDPPSVGELERVARDALAEDVGAGDVTTDGTIEPGATCRAELLLKEPGVVCGLGAAEAIFRALHPDIRLHALVADGDRFDDAPTTLAMVEGPAGSILTGERTALNLVARLSGIATLARRFADAVEGTGAVVLDTRKTTPGLRALEKYAVRCGGAQNHRLGLDDGILIKDNHLRLAGGIQSAVERIRRAGARGLPIEVEAETLDDVSEALAAEVDRILLDNMPLATMAQAVALVAGRAQLEVSGGVSLATVRTIAETGVDYISVGALTHSVRSLDVSLEVS
jgi:nicotinate-nucleotide pyrophosphorylase (carboxylating)